MAGNSSLSGEGQQPRQASFAGVGELDDPVIAACSCGVPRDDERCAGRYLLKTDRAALDAAGTPASPRLPNRYHAAARLSLPSSSIRLPKRGSEFAEYLADGLGDGSPLLSGRQLCRSGGPSGQHGAFGPIPTSCPGRLPPDLIGRPKRETAAVRI